VSVMDELAVELRALFERYEPRVILVAFAQEVSPDDETVGHLLTFRNHTHAMAILSDSRTLADLRRQAARDENARRGGRN
jgi:predicted component of type VI protein secretion system